VAAIKSGLSQRLRNKVPSLYLFLGIDQRVFCLVFGFAICGYSVYGTVVDSAIFNAGLCLLGPVLGCVAVVGWYRFARLNPYNKLSRSFGPPIASDQTDTDCRRLVEILRSAGAQHFIMRRSAQLAVTLIVLSAVIFTLFPARVEWGINPYSLFAGSMGCFVGALIFVGAELTNWGIRTWACTDER
jgi:hypothetical protein